MSIKLLSPKVVARKVTKGVIRISVGTAAASVATRVVNTILDQEENEEESSPFENLTTSIGVYGIAWTVQDAVGSVTDGLVDNVFDALSNETTKEMVVSEHAEPKKKETED